MTLQQDSSEAGAAGETGPLWDEILGALERMKQRDDLTTVEAEAVRVCQAAIGDVVIEQETQS